MDSKSHEPLTAELADPAENRPVPSTQGQWTRFANKTWLLLTTLFFVTGFLGLPLIFFSTKLTMPQKLLLSVVVIVWTCLLIYGTYLIVMWSWSRINEYPVF